MSEQITITVGKAAFQFDSFEHWVRAAGQCFKNTGLGSHNSICVDAKGRLALLGREFKRAAADGSFPIKVYPIDPEREAAVEAAIETLCSKEHC